jgi:hypothetical protein
VGQLIERLADAGVADMRARYDLGGIVHKLRYDRAREFGALTLANLAHAINLHPNTLHRYARVRESIALSEFEELLELRTPHGLPLSWSHLEVLARARRADVRRRCAREVAAESLPVRVAAKRLRSYMSATDCTNSPPIDRRLRPGR